MERGATELTLDGFCSSLGALVDEHLAVEEERRRTVSRLASGASFEGWLSFETRLIAEDSRAGLGLSGDVALRDGRTLPRYWLANEWRKVDLFIGETLADGTDRGAIALEFKVLHNNKNWPTKVHEVWRDLYPGRAAKATMELSIGRAAVVVLVGKVYGDGTWYPGQRADLEDWEQEVHEALSSRRNGQAIRLVWKGSRFAVVEGSIDPKYRNFVELSIWTAVDVLPAA